jgi:hypothetical protein
MKTVIQLLQSLSCLQMVVLGISLKLFVGMRRFKRRGAGGLQHFNNYFTGIITVAIEWAVQWIASILLLWGLARLRFG